MMSVTLTPSLKPNRRRQGNTCGASAPPPLGLKHCALPRCCPTALSSRRCHGFATAATNADDDDDDGNCTHPGLWRIVFATRSQRRRTGCAPAALVLSHKGCFSDAISRELGPLVATAHFLHLRHNHQISTRHQSSSASRLISWVPLKLNPAPLPPTIALVCSPAATNAPPSHPARELEGSGSLS